MAQRQGNPRRFCAWLSPPADREPFGRSAFTRHRRFFIGSNIVMSRVVGSRTIRNVDCSMLPGAKRVVRGSQAIATGCPACISIAGGAAAGIAQPRAMQSRLASRHCTVGASSSSSSMAIPFIGPDISCTANTPGYVTAASPINSGAPNDGSTTPRSDALAAHGASIQPAAPGCGVTEISNSATAARSAAVISPPSLMPATCKSGLARPGELRARAPSPRMFCSTSALPRSRPVSPAECLA